LFSFLPQANIVCYEESDMTDIFFMACRLLAVVAVGGIISILFGIALGKIEV
jgi:hypothetical protein